MEFLSKLALAVGAAVLFSAAIVIAAFLGGTIVWLIWPYALPLVFPKAIASGILVSKISWWSAVCTTWLLGILFKSGSVSKN